MQIGCTDTSKSGKLRLFKQTRLWTASPNYTEDMGQKTSQFDLNDQMHFNNLLDYICILYSFLFYWST